MRIGIIVLLCVLCSCEKPRETYYVRNFEKPAIFKVTAPPHEEVELPPPPIGPSYYTENNFIIDGNDNIYYYKGEDFKVRQCIIPKSIVEDLRPGLIELKPEKLKRIERNKLKDFLLTNIKLDERELVIIASARDSFTSPVLDKIDRTLKSRYSDHRIILRKVTHEEEVVLHHKKTKKHFNPSAYPWDTTRIKMPVPFIPLQRE